MLHLIKLAVGVRDVAHLREIQERNAKERPPLRHLTRNMPKRAAEVLGGGSVYWVINRAVVVRQRILEIRRDVWDDGTACAGIVLDPEHVRVAARPVKPFQGWRYLSAAEAPADVGAAGGGGAAGVEALPAELRLALARLALL